MLVFQNLNGLFRDVPLIGRWCQTEPLLLPSQVSEVLLNNSSIKHLLISWQNFSVKLGTSVEFHYVVQFFEAHGSKILIIKLQLNENCMVDLILSKKKYAEIAVSFKVTDLQNLFLNGY